MSAVNNHLHPIFQKILRAYAPATVEANSLSSDILDAIDGAEETRGRDSQLTQWADRALALEDALDRIANQSAGDYEDPEEEAYASRNIAHAALVKAGVR